MPKPSAFLKEILTGKPISDAKLMIFRDLLRDRLFEVIATEFKPKR